MDDDRFLLRLCLKNAVFVVSDVRPETQISILGIWALDKGLDRIRSYSPLNDIMMKQT